MQQHFKSNLMINFLCTSNQHKNPVETGLTRPVATALTLLLLFNCTSRTKFAYIKVTTDNIPPFFC